MKRKKQVLVILMVIVITGVTTAFKIFVPRPAMQPAPNPQPKACVFQTVFGLEPSDSDFIYKTPDKVEHSIANALKWIDKAQQNDGGWGAGSFGAQGVRDPHAVKSDPATTAIVSMALLRCNNTPFAGAYSTNLDHSTNYLLAVVEQVPEEDANITGLLNTQPQYKLGSNIDAILTLQYFTNLSAMLDDKPAFKERVLKCINKCIRKIQRAQNKDGSFKGSGWAGVLQSSLADNALETARNNGAQVDSVVLEKSREYQKGNYDKSTGSFKTDMGAGVMLYSTSSTGKASAGEARVAKQKIEEGKKRGLLKATDTISVANLQAVGLSYSQAANYDAAYEVNVASNIRSLDDRVMEGFGSNGGEEFLSYLQTGEGMIISKDREWKKWYDNTAGKLLQIQNADGSWNGHHCITSPVFCTATCLLVLSVNNDIEHLLRM